MVYCLRVVYTHDIDRCDTSMPVIFGDSYFEDYCLETVNRIVRAHEFLVKEEKVYTDFKLEVITLEQTGSPLVAGKKFSEASKLRTSRFSTFNNDLTMLLDKDGPSSKLRDRFDASERNFTVKRKREITADIEKLQQELRTLG